MNERAQRVLRASVESYIGKFEPIGSGYLTKKYNFNLSSATIRNIMADLEDRGYLAQPHTSAGRVPTDKGFRYFVDTIKVDDSSSEADKLLAYIRNKYQYLRDDINGLLSEVTGHVAGMTGCAVFAVPLRPGNTTLNRIQLFRYRGSRTVAVLLTNEGLVTNRVINSDFGLTQRELDRVSDFLNSEYAGYTISEVRDSIKERIAQEKAMRDILITTSIQITQEALAFDSSDIIMSGVPEFIGQPDFKSRINTIAMAIENKKQILKVLGGLSSGKAEVVIGGENPVKSFREFSIVTAEYTQGDRPLGRVGVIGPTRMNYKKNIPLVNVMASYVSSVIIG